jgi:lipoprotein-anchoring transpeptidase ErfK/SrfK
MSASGIVRVRTAFMPRMSRNSRPKLPRPSLLASLLLLGFAALLASGAALHRKLLDTRLSPFLSVPDAAPFEIRRIREDLADQMLDEKTLEAELRTRLDYARSQKAREFYVVVDTTRKRLAFKFGDKVLRDSPVEVGAPRVVKSKGGKIWNFVPVTGAFSVQQKLEDADWSIPGWVYAMNGKEAPRRLPEVPAGLGKYVLVFAGSYVIHSPPSPDSPLKTVKPASFMVPEADLAAIWRRVGPGTRIYVF